MIDSFLNLIFRCPHHRLTRPVTPVSKESPGDTYVVCLDCGKQFSYDVREMRIGKPLPTSADIGVLPPGMPGRRTSKTKLAAVASVLPIGIIIGSLLTAKRQRSRKPPDQPAPASEHDSSN
jgi:hypothetical protein